MTGAEAMRVARLAMDWGLAEMARQNAREAGRGDYNGGGVGGKKYREYRSIAASAGGRRRGLLNELRRIRLRGLDERVVADPGPLELDGGKSNDDAVTTKDATKDASRTVDAGHVPNLQAAPRRRTSR